MVQGLDVDAASRCRHWHAHHDVVAFRFPCCGWWACRDCHDDLADHAAERIPVAHEALAVRCGACGHDMTADHYLDALRQGDACPSCRHAWNPGCRGHHDRYFLDARGWPLRPGARSSVGPRRRGRLADLAQ